MTAIVCLHLFFFSSLCLNQILWFLRTSERYSLQNFHNWDVQRTTLFSVFSILKPLIAGKLFEINRGMKTSKRFHLNPSRTDNLISHDKAKLTGWCKFWQLFLWGFVKGVQVIQWLKSLNPYRFHQKIQQLLLNLLNNIFNNYRISSSLPYFTEK